MSYVRPEDLFEQIEPWSAETWKKFIENHIVPLNRLSKIYAKYFEGDTSSQVASYVAEASDKVLSVAESMLGYIKKEYAVPEDPIEVGRLLMEHAVNTFLGVGEGGKHSFFIFSLRKLPREYAYKLYPKLEKEPETREKVFKLLGINELWKPYITSPLAEKLTLMGYPDYPMYCRVEKHGYTISLRVLPSKESTLGGTISRLIESLMAILARPGMLSAYELSIDVLTEYDRAVSGIVSLPRETGEYLKVKYADSYIKLKENSLVGEWNFCGIVEGLGVKVVSSVTPESYTISRESNLLTEFRKWSSLLVLGKAELLFAILGRYILLLPLVRVISL
ncbi:MAG: hypothetical protein DRN53_01960 [Thermoprotei archaeon]|nr:MAG: hypothetical protein DRN53_01960 [Thermoprotei archaeon]